jgi:hypothetical protein
MNTVIENDETRLVKEDRITRVSQNDLHQVGGYFVQNVEMSSNVKVGGNYYTVVGGGIGLSKVNFPSKYSDMSEKILKRNFGYHFRAPSGSDGNYTLHAKGIITLIAEESFQVETSQTFSLSTQEGFHAYSQKYISFGSAGEFKAIATDTIHLKSGKRIVLECGEGSITINVDGVITLKGTKIDLN